MVVADDGGRFGRCALRSTSESDSVVDDSKSAAGYDIAGADDDDDVVLRLGVAAQE